MQRQEKPCSQHCSQLLPPKHPHSTPPNVPLRALPNSTFARPSRPPTPFLSAPLSTGKTFFCQHNAFLGRKPPKPSVLPLSKTACVYSLNICRIPKKNIKRAPLFLPTPPRTPVALAARLGGNANRLYRAGNFGARRGVYSISLLSFFLAK